MKNRISFRPTTEFQQEYITVLDKLIALNNQILSGKSEDNNASGLAMGDGNNRLFGQNGLKVAQTFPNLVDEDAQFTVQDYENNVELDNFFQAIMPKAQSYAEQVNFADISNGRDIMDKAHYVLKMIRPKSELPKYKTMFEMFNAHYERRSTQAAGTAKMKGLLKAQTLVAEPK